MGSRPFSSRALAKVRADKPDKRKKDRPVSVPESFGMGSLLIVLAVAGVGYWALARSNGVMAHFDLAIILEILLGSYAVKMPQSAIDQHPAGDGRGSHGDFRHAIFRQ